MGQTLTLRKGDYFPSAGNYHGIAHIEFPRQNLRQTWNAFLAANHLGGRIASPAHDSPTDGKSGDFPALQPGELYIDLESNRILRDNRTAKPGQWLLYHISGWGLYLRQQVTQILPDGSLVIRNDWLDNRGKETMASNEYVLSTRDAPQIIRTDGTFAGVSKMKVPIGDQEIEVIRVEMAPGNSPEIYHVSDALPFGGLVAEYMASATGKFRSIRIKLVGFGDNAEEIDAGKEPKN